MTPFPHRRPSLKTLLGIAKAKNPTERNADVLINRGSTVTTLASRFFQIILCIVQNETGVSQVVFPFLIDPERSWCV
jgi:hypothetical protein